MTLLSFVAVMLLVPMLGIALWNLATAPRLERAGEPCTSPRVSLLIPARDEAENLRSALPLLMETDLPGLEILVLDDGSRDETAEVVSQHAASAGGRVRLLRGAPLPDGWVGKNWACHQLAAAALGEVLIFCDADVLVYDGAVSRTVAALERHGAGAVTALPKQRFGSWMEAAVVPLVVHLPVAALLPLNLVGRTRSPRLSMANGQWLAFTRAAYDACGGHAGVRGEVVEDVALGRRVKASGHRLLPMIATALLEVRMYRDSEAVQEGFTKNLYPLLGARPAPFIAALGVFLVAAVYPWMGTLLGAQGAPLALALLVALRGSGALLLRQGVTSIVLHPAGSLILPWIAVRSFRGWRRGTLRWKGRGVGGRKPSGAKGEVVALESARE